VSVLRPIGLLAVVGLLAAAACAQPASSVAAPPLPAYVDAAAAATTPVLPPDVVISPASEPPSRLPEGPLSARAEGSVLEIYRRPDVASGVKYGVSALNPWDERVAFSVVGRATDAGGGTWLRLLLGVEPNGASGWVRLSDVSVRRAHDRIVVDMSGTRLRHFRDGKLMRRYNVAIGAPQTPTTPGRFFVWAKLPSDPGGPYGSFVLGLSGFSEVLTGWPGGGRMAIHGTDNPADRGHAVSYGCIRVYNPQMLTLRGVPMGTPVLIRP
jgi:lipoprotein-anchoring transpeptidase ErfK/SrfK